MPGVQPIDPEPNYDEAAAGGVALPPLTDANGRAPGSPADLAGAQGHWRDMLARHLYGPIPPPPDTISISRAPLPCDRCERITITCRVGRREFSAEAVFWRPRDDKAPAPLIVGLGFLGPAGVLFDEAFPLDADAVVAGGPELRLVDGRLDDTVRGMESRSWPIPMLRRAGYGVLLACYGSWTPDHPATFRTHGTATLFDGFATGAISLWAWAVSRLVDAASQLPGVDAARVVIAGHSRLGKAVLWAGANDPRVAGVFANDAGCGGPALSRRNFGETLVHMERRFPHWTVLDAATASAPDALPFDQHHLLACIAPRPLCLASGSDDRWADPRGEFLGLRAALDAWRIGDPAMGLPEADAALFAGNAVRSGAVGWHLRPGGHALTPWDWRHALEFFTGHDQAKISNRE
jgi:hypothetical protein